MKKIALIVALLCSQLLKADKQDILLQSLSQVNSEWKKQTDVLPVLQQTEFVSSQSFSDWIALHLLLVEKTLRSRDVSKLSAAQQQNRTALLDELKKYAAAKTYPVNDYLPYKQPVFIDRSGTHCAVGYLMQQNGKESLAQKINAAEKFAFVHEIKTPGVKEWAAENGFSVDELAWIQPQYMPRTVFTPLGTGTNGPVKFLVPLNTTTGDLVVAGAFDTLNDLPCSNIGVYENYQLRCFGIGLQGLINDIRVSQSYPLVAGGNFQSGNRFYPMAFYNGNNWEFDSIPNREGAIATAIYTGGYGYIAEVAITHPSFPGKQEIWYKRNVGTWQKQGTVNGVILDITASNLGRVYVGAFDSVMYTSFFFGDTVIAVKNVVFYEDYLDKWFGIGSEISDTVLVVKSVGSAIYFGGTCSNSLGGNNVCLSRYLNGTLQPLILSTFSSLPVVIRTFELYDSHRLIIGGDFEMDYSISDFGRNLGLYDLTTNYFISYGYLNNSVNTVSGDFFNNWYLGGDFTANINKPLPRLAKIGGPTSIDYIDSESAIQIYPNPANDNFTLVTPESKTYQLEIFNSVGEKIVEQQTQQGNDAIRCKDFPKGLYVVRINDGEKSYSQRLIVQ